ncbi:hypothetical protein IIB34_04620, partial [PVC group bacterium]|nr:hypothetical protein [PVC group bacterium]
AGDAAKEDERKDERIIRNLVGDLESCLKNIPEYDQEEIHAKQKNLKVIIMRRDLDPKKLPQGLAEVQQALKEREKNLAKEEKNLVKKTAEDICHDVFKVNSVQCVASQVTVSDVPQLRLMMDAIKKKLQSGIFVLGAEIASKGVLLVGVSKDCLKTGYHAGRIVAALAKEAGGSGGGKPELAQAGVPDASRLEHVVSNAKSIIKNTK